MKKIAIPKPEDLKDLASRNKKENQLLIKKLRRVSHGNLDKAIHALHEAFFAEFNCLDCANCCTTISPIITYHDAEKLAKYLGMKPGAFREKYLHEDEEGDLVFNAAPCPFLDKNRLCKVYDVRPKACREYPHTDRKNMHQILDLCFKNTFSCPVVYAIFEKLKT